MDHDHLGVGFRRVLNDLKAYHSSLILLLTPLLALPVLCISGPESKCAYCVIVMAVYWMCEVMPLAVTAMLPVFMFPILGVLDAKTVSKEFLPDTNFLFIGGLIVAVAIEKCNLHERIALKVLSVVGSQPKWIMLGFMCVTAFLSMWISNTATTAMMVPIAESVINQLTRTQNNNLPNHNNDVIAPNTEVALRLMRNDNGDVEHEETEALDDKQERKGALNARDSSVAKGLLISVCFAANIGGTATITGTPPNLVMVGQLERLFPSGADTGINYLSWIAFALPLMIVSLLLCWLLLFAYFMRNSPPIDESITQVMRQKYRNLPPMSFAEKSVLACFLILLFMWITRDPKFMPGFGELFPQNHFTDATSAMLIAVLLFALPNETPDILCNPRRDRTRDPVVRGALMDWSAMQNKFPWSVVLLLGGGFAVAAGVKASGLSLVIGELLGGLGGLPVWAIQLVCVLITMLVTNICSNTVTASIFVPIVATLAQNLEINPLALMLPVTLACSYAFVLPVATPPNAIVFANGLLKVTDMMVAGLLMSVVGALATVAHMLTFGRMILPLDVFPQWAAVPNITSTAPLQRT
uniref:Uncharacterized protein n=1 Tax=Plectus sambesii TaxID=2011161 RepID=A0A914WKT5_9BILA